MNGKISVLQTRVAFISRRRYSETLKFGALRGARRRLREFGEKPRYGTHLTRMHLLEKTLTLKILVRQVLDVPLSNFFPPRLFQREQGGEENFISYHVTLHPLDFRFLFFLFCVLLHGIKFNKVI